MTDAEQEEARRIVAAQASTSPADGDLSPEGSLRRAEGVCDVNGRRLGLERATPTGFPSHFPSQSWRARP